MVTANGKPSGTATTMMVTAKMKKRRGPSANCLMGKPRFSTHHRMRRTVKQRTPTPRPTLPTAAASTVSASCRGVSPVSPTTIAMVRPHSEWTPTAVTSSVPDPSDTCVPHRTQGERSTLFLMGSDSPVREASSMTRPCAARRTPSAATLSPVIRRTTSPTTRSVFRTSCSTPARTTLISTRSFWALSLRNWRSFW